tara:strand:+ start:1952 stop:2188 length:237 start_codon:yes stop_codon:yes gene_type:complete
MKLILVASVEDGDRQELESITNQKFNSVNEIRDSLDFPVDIYNLSEFMDACNDTDDDSYELSIKIEESWVGYVEVKES